MENKKNEVAVQKPFSVFMESVGNKLVAKTLVDSKRSNQFIANIISAVSNNPTLQECDQTSIVSAALQAEALHFPINNSLGYVYLVPFNDKNAQLKKAQFQIGYKGYIQLAIRSGQYKDINVVEVKEGELGEFDPLNGQEFHWVTNYLERKKLKTIGYVGQLELINGFRKQLYISYEEMLDHADTYSQAFNKDIYLKLQRGEQVKDAWKYSSFWYKRFDEMAKKTVIRQLLSKWGIMSVELLDAYNKDQAEIKADGSYEYIDSKFESATTQEVAQKQEKETATIKVNPEVVSEKEVKADNEPTDIFGKYINNDEEKKNWMN